MNLQFGPREEAFRQEVRAYLQANFTPELWKELDEREDLESRGPLTRAFIRKMGRDGWLGVGWPRGYGGAGGGGGGGAREYGGQGRSWSEQFIFFEELWYHEPTFYFVFPLAAVAITGPALMR